MSVYRENVTCEVCDSFKQKGDAFCRRCYYLLSTEDRKRCFNASSDVHDELMVVIRKRVFEKGKEQEGKRRGRYDSVGEKRKKETAPNCDGGIPVQMPLDPLPVHQDLCADFRAVVALNALYVKEKRTHRRGLELHSISLRERAAYLLGEAAELFVAAQEAGEEVTESSRNAILDEMGDVLAVLGGLAHQLGFASEEVCLAAISKMTSRFIPPDPVTTTDQAPTANQAPIACTYRTIACVRDHQASPCVCSEKGHWYDLPPCADECDGTRIYVGGDCVVCSRSRVDDVKRIRMEAKKLEDEQRRKQRLRKFHGQSSTDYCTACKVSDGEDHRDDCEWLARR